MLNLFNPFTWFTRPTPPQDEPIRYEQLAAKYPCSVCGNRVYVVMDAITAQQLTRSQRTLVCAGRERSSVVVSEDDEAQLYEDIYIKEDA